MGLLQVTSTVPPDGIELPLKPAAVCCPQGRQPLMRALAPSDGIDLRLKPAEVHCPQGSQPPMCPAKGSQGASLPPRRASAHPTHRYSIWQQAGAEQVGMPMLHQQSCSPLRSALRLRGQQDTGQICRPDVVRGDAGAVDAHGARLDACMPATHSGLGMMRERI